MGYQPPETKMFTSIDMSNQEVPTVAQNTVNCQWKTTRHNAHFKETHQTELWVLCPHF